MIGVGKTINVIASIIAIIMSNIISIGMVNNVKQYRYQQQLQQQQQLLQFFSFASAPFAHVDVRFHLHKQFDTGGLIVISCEMQCGPSVPDDARQHALA
jgi:hypothetical protein